MKTVLILFVIMGLTAGCSSDDGGKKKDPSLVRGVGNNPQKDLTDYQLCNQSRPATSPQGQWMQKRQSGEMQTTMRLQLSRDYMRLSMECAMNGHVLNASAGSSVADDGRHLEVLSEDQDQKNYSDDSIRMDCSISLKPMRINYSFQGACLVLTKDGESEKIVLVPVN